MNIQMKCLWIQREIVNVTAGNSEIISRRIFKTAWDSLFGELNSKFFRIAVKTDIWITHLSCSEWLFFVQAIGSLFPQYKVSQYVERSYKIAKKGQIKKHHHLAKISTYTHTPTYFFLTILHKANLTSLSTTAMYRKVFYPEKVLNLHDTMSVSLSLV